MHIHKRYDWSMSLGEYLLTDKTQRTVGLIGLVFVIHRIHMKYEIDLTLLIAFGTALLASLLLYESRKHKKYFMDGFFEINDDIITWRFGGDNHTYNIASIRDIEVPRKWRRTYFDSLELHFGDGRIIDLDSSFPNFTELKKELLQAIAHHPELQFLEGKFRGVEIRN